MNDKTEHEGRDAGNEGQGKGQDQGGQQGGQGQQQQGEKGNPLGSPATPENPTPSQSR